MPKREPMDDWSAITNAHWGSFTEWDSATRNEPTETPIRDEHRRIVASVVSEIWDDFSDFEQAVYVLRFEARPPWTHEKIARVVHQTRSAVTYCEHRIYEKVKGRIFTKMA